jgi:hypothetical protein
VTLPHFRGGSIAGSIGFVADPRSLKRFYVANPTCQVIASFRDLKLYGLGKNYTYNSGGVVDFDYPLSKPDHTFRILLLGRSYLAYIIKTATFPLDGNNKVPVAKQLEITLNTLGALDDVSMHFEVFNMGFVSEHQLSVLSYYRAPPAAEKYDADMVLIMMDPGCGMESYFLGPLTKEGIPPEKEDPEFMSKPNNEKFKSGPLHELFNLCNEKKILEEDKDGKWSNPPSFSQMIADPEIRKKLAEIIGKPLDLLNQKLKSEKTSEGKPRKLVFCFFPTADVYTDFSFPAKNCRAFWKDLCHEKGISFLDLTDDFTTLRLTFFPFSEENGRDHFDGNGHKLFNFILAHELIKQKIIPFEPANVESLPSSTH